MSVNLGSSITYANSWQNDLTFEHSLISMIFERSALKMLEGGGRSLPLAAFVNKKGGSALGGGAGDFYYKGYRLSRDRAVNSGNGPHGDSYWKLFNKQNNRIGTYDRQGKYLRP